MPEPRRVAILLDLEWPYKRHAGVFVGTQQYGQEHGWESAIDEYADHTLLGEAGAPPPYDGIIARATRKLARRAARRGVPVVNVWASSPVWRSLPGVFVDYAAAGRLCAEHLLSRGFYRFANLRREGDRGHALAGNAFAQMVAAAGYPCVSTAVPLDSVSVLKNWLRSKETIAAWMQEWRLPIGVYVSTEADGRMVAQMCRARGWRVPEDAAIITGSNEETLCEHMRPTLSSVELGYERIGYEAARLLDQLMDGKSPPDEPILHLPQGLVVRESSDFFAVDNKRVAAALEFIAANCHQPIGPDDVARAVSTETRTLRNYFRKHLDRSIAAEIRRGRIERAKRELAQTGRTISQISFGVGFGPPKRMYEIFVREVGVTPSEYRRQRQSQRET